MGFEDMVTEEYGGSNIVVRWNDNGAYFPMTCDWKDMVTEEHGIMVTDLMVLLFLYTHCSFAFLFVPLCHYKMIIFSK